uniref:DNA-directed RNA polymerase n=1 Tax=Angiostrongylus cantonensis TaxID=6313 RepID=A0A0K0D9Q7_ANGCA
MNVNKLYQLPLDFYTNVFVKRFVDVIVAERLNGSVGLRMKIEPGESVGESSILLYLLLFTAYLLRQT